MHGARRKVLEYFCTPQRKCMAVIVDAADIPPDVLDLYDTLTKQLDGEATAQVEIESFRHKEFSCSACSMQIPFAIVSNLYSGLGRVQQCTNCRCIMLLGEEVRNELDKDSKKNVKRREKAAREG